MRKIILYTIALVAALTANAQTVQNGFVKEYNEKEVKTPLAGVELNVRSANSTVSDNNGVFSLNFLTLKPGERINVRRIEKLGYEVFNKEAIEQWNLNPKNPFIIVMCKSEKFKKIRDNYEKVSSESYAKQLKKEEAALAKLKTDGKIKEEEYQKRIFKLREDYETQLDNLDNYIDRFSRIDLSELSSIELEIIELIQSGEIEEAITKYEEQNFVDKYVQEVSQIKEVSNAIDRLEDVKLSKETVIDSILSSIDRQVETLRLAGGKENFEKLGFILKKIALVDTNNVNNIIKYAEFCLKQNKLNEAQDILCRCPFSNSESEIESVFKILMLYGNLNSIKDFFPAATDYYLQALVLAEKIGDKHMLSTVYHNIGTTLLNQEKYDEALEYLYKAKGIREESPEKSIEEIHELSTTYGNIARVFENKKDFKNALKYYQKAIYHQKIDVESDFGKYGVTLANTYNSLGALYHEIRDFDNAKEIYLLGLNILEKIYHHNPFSSALTYANMLNNYAAFLIEIKYYDESLLYFSKAIDSYNFLSSFAPIIVVKPLAMTKVNLANTNINLGRYDEAKNALEESFLLFDNLSSEETPYVNERVTILSNYAIVLTDLHDINGAENNYMKAYEICKSTNENSLPTEITRGRTYFNIGNFYSTILNKQKDAQPYFMQSIDHFKKLMTTVPQMSAYVSMSLNGLAYCHAFQGNHENAINTINEAISLSPNDHNLIDSKVEIQATFKDFEGAKNTLEEFKRLNPEFDVTKLPSYQLIYEETVR